MPEEKKPYDDVEFDWIQLSVDLDGKKETFMQKAERKFKENPFVPIGGFGACGALIYGLHSMFKGDSQKSQYAMRARIGFQGFAVAALVVGFVYGQIPTEKSDNK